MTNQNCLQDENSVKLSYHDHNLIWVDMEMTGLNSDTDRILEIAIIVTDAQLAIQVTSPVLAIYQNDDILNAMDDWNQKTHSRTGLIQRVKQEGMSEKKAEQTLLDFLKPYISKGKSPMCGNSICQDRRFMERWMPELGSYFHYRNLDVSTIKELCRRWQPELIKGFVKQGKHSALADIQESIDELKYFREHFIGRGLSFP